MFLSPFLDCNYATRPLPLRIYMKKRVYFLRREIFLFLTNEHGCLDVTQKPAILSFIEKCFFHHSNREHVISPG